MGSIADQVLAAAARGDRLAFTAAAARYGTLDEAHRLVRDEGVVRMVDRGAAALEIVLPQPTLQPTRAEADEEAGDGSLMFGHFAVFNEWTEINSWFEGHFMERLAPGSMRKTIRENRDAIKVLFQHGADPQIGDKPLGPIDDLREDDRGGYYEVPLLEADYVRNDVLPGLQAGLYGASFRFQVMREEFETEPGPSDTNPSGLPERTIKELRLFEFGPVTFPAYQSATAGVRSTNADEATPPAEDAATDTPHHDREPAVVAGVRSHLVLGRRGSRTITLNDRKEGPSWLL